MRRRVVIESPFGRNVDGSVCTPEQYARNTRYLKRCIADSLKRNESPYASHRFFPGVLDDTKPEERKLGIDAGQDWGMCAQLCGVYLDHGETDGMSKSIRRYVDAGIPLEMRRIGPEPDLAMLHCPFCGSDDLDTRYAYDDNGSPLQVVCCKCLARGPESEDAQRIVLGAEARVAYERSAIQALNARQLWSERK